MEAGQQRWLQLINRIDRAGIDKQKELMARQTLRRQHYVDLIRSERQDKLTKKQQQDLLKYSQRRLVDDQVKTDAERNRVERRQRKQKQKGYGQDNLSLVRHRRNKTLANIEFPQHPFIKLVDEDDKRQSMLRQDFRRQNQANEVQQDIKRQQKQLQKIKDHEDRRQYENHVEQYFRKRQDNLRRQRIRHLYSNSIELNTSDQIDQIEKKLYNKYLNELKKTFRTRRRLKTDNTMSLYEQNVNNPEISTSASPALLGRVPIAHDRMKQLDILDRELGLSKDQIHTAIARLPEKLPQADPFTMQMRGLERKRDSSRLSRYQAQIRAKQPETKPKMKSDVKTVTKVELQPPKQPTLQVIPIRVPETTKQANTRRTIKTYNFLTNQPQLYNI